MCARAADTRGWKCPHCPWGDSRGTRDYIPGLGHEATGWSWSCPRSAVSDPNSELLAQLRGWWVAPSTVWAVRKGPWRPTGRARLVCMGAVRVRARPLCPATASLQERLCFS